MNNLIKYYQTLIKWLFRKRSNGTTLLIESTRDLATYPTADDNFLKSNAKVTCASVCPIIL